MSFDIAGSPLVVVCSPEQGLATKDAVSLVALAEVTLAGYPPGWGVRSLSDLALRSVGIEPHYAFEVNDTATLLDLVEAGLGVWHCPRGHSRSEEVAAAPADSKWPAVAVAGQRAGLSPRPLEPRCAGLLDDVDH